MTTRLPAAMPRLACRNRALVRTSFHPSTLPFVSCHLTPTVGPQLGRGLTAASWAKNAFDPRRSTCLNGPRTRVYGCFENAVGVQDSAKQLLMRMGSETSGPTPQVVLKIADRIFHGASSRRESHHCTLFRKVQWPVTPLVHYVEPTLFSRICARGHWHRISVKSHRTRASRSLPVSADPSPLSRFPESLSE